MIPLSKYPEFCDLYFEKIPPLIIIPTTQLLSKFNMGYPDKSSCERLVLKE